MNLVNPTSPSRLPLFLSLAFGSERMGGVPGGILERACKRRLRYFESLRSRSAWGRKVRGSCPKNTESAASLLSARFNEKEDAVYAYNSCEAVLCIKESLDTDYGLTCSRHPSVSRKLKSTRRAIREHRSPRLGTKQRPAHRILHGKTKGGERRLSAIMFTDVVGIK